MNKYSYFLMMNIDSHDDMVNSTSNRRWTIYTHLLHAQQLPLSRPTLFLLSFAGTKRE